MLHIHSHHLAKKMENQNREKIGNKIIQNMQDLQNNSTGWILGITKQIRKSSVIRR